MNLEGKIQLVEGTFDETCTVEDDLGQNDIAFPIVSEILSYTEKRMTTTLIVSGATEGYQGARFRDDIKTKIGTIPSDKLIGRSGYRYRLQGRIQKASVITRQLGVADADGKFQLVMADNYLTPGMNAEFNGERFTARVYSAPSGSAGNWVYTFESVDGTQFDWDTHVAGQGGTLTCFGGYNSMSEKSTRGYSRTHYPDMYINHTTIQRKSKSISGSAASTVLWIDFDGEKGWMYTALRQMRAQASVEDEHAKIWGKSNMKGANGELLESSRHVDSETGLHITQGDGLWEQVRGKNDTYTSGVGGKPVIADFKDMMSQLKEKAQDIEGNTWYAVTGTEGMQNANDVLELEATSKYHIHIDGNGNDKTGGKDIATGYNWNRYNVNGNSVVFVEHPLFGDRQRFTDEAADGQNMMGSSYLWLANYSLDSGKKNIEILGRGAYGNNRTAVMGKIHGMTGAFATLGGAIQTPVDADEYHHLKEDGIFIYDTTCCAIMHRTRG